MGGTRTWVHESRSSLHEARTWLPESRSRIRRCGSCSRTRGAGSGSRGARSGTAEPDPRAAETDPRVAEGVDCGAPGHPWAAGGTPRRPAPTLRGTETPGLPLPSPGPERRPFQKVRQRLRRPHDHLQGVRRQSRADERTYSVPLSSPSPIFRLDKRAVPRVPCPGRQKAHVRGELTVGGPGGGPLDPPLAPCRSRLRKPSGLLFPWGFPTAAPEATDTSGPSSPRDRSRTCATMQNTMAHGRTVTF
jgi:hypothetical protein